MIGAGAWRAKALTFGGAALAAIMGTIAVAAGWDWAIVLIAYFVAATVLSHLPGADTTIGTLPDPAPRHAGQVLANGAVFLVMATIVAVPALHAAMLGSNIALAQHVTLGVTLGALAASSADTWATEIGIRLGGTPRHLLTGKRVDAGMSGGVTWAGTAGALGGALWIGVAGVAVGWGATTLFIATLAGLCGAMADSLLGGTIQARYRCPHCGSVTERAIHPCGHVTILDGGFRSMTNDWVNWCATLVGGIAGGVLGGFLTGVMGRG